MVPDVVAGKVADPDGFQQGTIEYLRSRRLEGVQLVVKSPGVPAESPLIAGARSRDIPVWSEVELGYRLLPAARV